MTQSSTNNNCRCLADSLQRARQQQHYSVAYVLFPSFFLHPIYYLRPSILRRRSMYEYKDLGHYEYTWSNIGLLLYVRVHQHIYSLNSHQVTQSMHADVPMRSNLSNA